MSDKITKATLNKIVEKGIADYIRSREEKVPIFIKQHFHIKGALKIHKKAFGKDLYKAPLNIAWSVPYLLTRATSTLLKKVGEKKISAFLRRTPIGFETNVQKEVKWLLYTEFLELPYADGERTSEKDALFEEILNQKEVNEILTDYLDKIGLKSKDSHFKEQLEKKLMEYSSSRTAASELAGNIITLATGYFAFHKATPGTLTGGSAAAAAIAQQIAVSNFWLGSTIGSMYYSIFPATASTGLIIASTGTLMAAMAVLSSFIGIITDPIQAKLGLHKKRLDKLIDSLKMELLGTGLNEFKLKDRYVARVFDVLDLLKTAAQAI